MRVIKSQKRNLNPHKQAVTAMWIYSSSYAKQNGGSMDFWDSLSDGQKDYCRRFVADLEKRPNENEKQKWLRPEQEGTYDTIYECPDCGASYSVAMEDTINALTCKCGFHGKLY